MPQPFTLIIKGTPQQAVAAAKKHGATIHHAARTVGHNEVVAIAEAVETDLQKWFWEGPSVAPFPSGSLLLYSPRENLHRIQEMGVPR